MTTNDAADFNDEQMRMQPKMSPVEKHSELVKEVLGEIANERAYQLTPKSQGGAGWSDEFDHNNTANDWVTYIVRYAAKACGFNLQREDFETAMIKVATLALSAVVTSRAHKGPAPRHYDN